MSMEYYAVDDYGLVLDKETIKVIASKVFDDFVDNDEVFGDWGYELYDKGICDWIGEFTGEAQFIEDDGLFSWFSDSKNYNSDEIYYVHVRQYPTLFRPAYNNMEEIVEEFKSKLGEYLPEDFDYRSRIRHIVGTYYG